MALPKGFVDLSATYTSQSNSFVNIIGVVVDTQDVTTTRSGEYMVTFKLLDEALRDSYLGSEGLKIRFFAKDFTNLPQVQQCGDVVLLRNAKMTMFAEQPLAISNYQTQVLVFQAESIPEPGYLIAYQDKKRLPCLGKPMDIQRLTLEEQAYVIQLKHDMNATLQSMVGKRANFRFEPPTGPAAMRKALPAMPPEEVCAGEKPSQKRAGENLPQPAAKKPKMSSFGPKFCKVHEARHGTYKDLCVMVVKKFSTNSGKCELYVTDYTENKEVYQYLPPEAEGDGTRDGDDYGYSGGGASKQWPGPYGQLVLKINVKQPHSDYTNRNVEEGDIVLLQNVKMRAMPDGNCRLEGNMWPDDLDPQRVKVKKLKTGGDIPEIKALLERKTRYWMARNDKLALKNGNGEKEYKDMTKKQKKKFNKQRQQEREKELKRLVDETNRTTEDVPADPKDQENAEAIPPKPKPKIESNAHIRCGHQEVPLSTLRDILDSGNKRHTHKFDDGTTQILPFINAKYRACVRVIDFQPRPLARFSRPKPTETSQGTHEESQTFLDDDMLTSSHEWSFSLQLQDAQSGVDSLWVNVPHESAQYLFGNDIPDPTDLNNDKKLLAKIREKLCILWGNVEEKGAGDEVKNKPFECCLMEYGVEVNGDGTDSEGGEIGWRRMYGLFGVTIS